MRFRFDPEHDELRQVIRRLLAGSAGAAAVIALADEPVACDPKLTAGLAEIGVYGLGVPERFGGGGFGLLELGVVCQEAGRAVLGAPLLSAVLAADRAFATVPAPILRWGVSLFDPEVRPTQVSGNTVVSSIYRVPTDLRLGDAPVMLTAVYPGLSPAMGLTHGVWGVGDMVTVSVHGAESAIGDIDDYVARLDAEL